MFYNMFSLLNNTVHPTALYRPWRDRSNIEPDPAT